MKLKIDGENIDLGNNIVEITKQLFDFSDITQRYLGRTNMFSFPKTNINSEKLNNPSTVNSNNDSFQKFYNALLQDSNIFLFKGQGILKESNREYKMQLIEDSKLFFDSLKGKLKDLYFESSDFTYNLSAYNTLKIENAGIWIWSVMSQHENKDVSKSLLDTTPNLAFTRPWFRVSKILDAIFDNSDWSHEFTETIDEFERAQISSNHKEFFVTDYQKTLDTTIAVSGTPVSLTGLDTNDFEQADLTTTSTTIDIVTHESKFRFRGDVVVSGDVKIIVEAQSSPGTDDVFSQEFILDPNETTIDITTDAIKTDETNNIVQIIIDGTGSVEFQDTLLYTIIEEESLGEFQNNELTGFRVKVHDNMQDLSQIDFLQNLWTQFGIIFDVDPYLKKIKFFTVKNINRLNSLDWSDKFIQDTDTIQGKIGKYGQINFMLYDNDDETGPNVGGSRFLIDDLTLENEKEIIKLFWGACKEAVVDTETQVDMPVYNDTERIFDANPRIATYRDGSTQAISQFNEISWTNLLSNYYSILNSLERTRFIECFMNLTRSDFVNYNFSKSVYIEFFKAYFMVQRIDSFIAGVPVKVELMKLD
jgi:hypothetical protein